MSSARRWISSFLTGDADDSVSASADPAAPQRRPTRVARPVSASVPAEPAAVGAPAAPPVPDGQVAAPPPGQGQVALPDFVDPPGTELVAGVDADGVEYVFEDDPYADPLVDPRYDADDRNWVRYRPNWGGYLRFVVLALVVVFAIFWGRGKIYDWIDGEITPASAPGETVEFVIQSGASTNDVASQLAEEGVIGNATVFRYWLRCDGNITISGFLGCDTEHSFQAGDYELQENMAFEDVVAVFEEGPIPIELVKVTIPEGLRVTEFVERAIEENPAFNEEEMLEALGDPALRSRYLPEDVSIFYWFEGLLFPATYDIPEADLGNERAFVARLTEEFDRRYTALLDEYGVPPEAEALGLSDYQLITIASLIEEEAKVPEDRAKMARAIYRRLEEGDLLGIDASTYYAVGKSFTEELTVEDLENPSPWNTRAVAGIPPTPIAAPGEASLIAVLRPEPGEFYFWVRTGEDGSHTFSATAAEHEAAVEICRAGGWC